MPDPLVIAQATDKGASEPSSLAKSLTQDAASIANVPGDFAQLPFIQHLGQAMPAADVAFGGGMLMLIIVIHATGVRMVTSAFARRLRIASLRPSIWQSDLLMAMAIMALLALHLVEVIVWAASLVYSGLVPSWRAAGFFAGNTYTTVGYGAFVLPSGWEMLAPIIAISGLFTFGWSGSVLVDIVARCQRLKDLVADHDIKRDDKPPA